MVLQPTKCEEITHRTQAGNLPKGDSCDIGPMAKLFPLMNIGQMHFNRWQADRRNRIPDRNARMSIGGRVDDNSVVSCPRLLNPGDQLSLVIRLAYIYLYGQLFCQLCNG